MLGLRESHAPLLIHNDQGAFYVGAGLHDYGRPLKNLDVDRFNGTPEMRTLLHGSLTRYQQRYGRSEQPLSVVVELPNELLIGEQVERTMGLRHGVGEEELPYQYSSGNFHGRLAHP